MMNDIEIKALKEFISSRQEIALNRLNYKIRYLEISERQAKTGDVVEELLHRFEKDDRISIRRHYEGETEKTGIELDEVYIQGLRDGIKILTLLGVFNTEINL